MAKSDRDILGEAKERYKTSCDAWEQPYKEAIDDLNFVYAVGKYGQWPQEVYDDRKGRPMITINKLLKFVRKLRGETRINRPRIRVIPVDNGADKDKAKLFDGLIRMIEYQSNAEVAYDTAYQSAISCSIGFMRLLTEYEDELSFDQKISIKRIPNFASVHIDPSYKEFDTSDINYAFIEDNISEEEFKRLYPKGKVGGETFGGGYGTQYDLWYQDKKVKIAEYFYKEFTEREIALVETPSKDGNKIHTGVMDYGDEEAKREIMRVKGKVLDTRKTQVASVNWCKHTGMEVLERGTWVGKHIPIIPMFGDEVIVEGKRFILSLTRGAKEPQRMYNYWTSAATEAVALVPKSPFIVAAKQIANYENEWLDANLKNRPFLRYNSYPAIPPPQRQPQAMIPAGMITMMQNASIEIEDHLGQYEASKGAPSNERSGAAIDARAKQSDKGTFTFVDNETRAITYLGKQLLDLIPKVYDTERALKVYGEDGSQQDVTINQSMGVLDDNQNPIIANDLSIGRYDLIATVGASYASRREEEASKLLEAMQYAPELASIIAPFMFEMSDWPGSQELAAKLKEAIAAQQQAVAMGGGTTK